MTAEHLLDHDPDRIEHGLDRPGRVSQGSVLGGGSGELGPGLLKLGLKGLNLCFVSSGLVLKASVLASQALVAQISLADLTAEA